MEYKVYVIVNMDLNMSAGKIASQVGHAIFQLAKHCDKALIKKWEINGSPIIVVKSNYDDMRDILLDTINSYPVYDAGRTQVKEDALTVLALEPIGIIPKWLQRYNLL